MLYNVSKWISNRGYLFIDVFQNINYLKQYMSNKNNGKFIKLNYKYSDKIKNISNQKFYFIEHIKIENDEKSNYHEITYYSNDFLKGVARECGLTFVKYYDTISSITGRGVIVFQKI
jgi:NAD+--asparagine ADP-ribosyltransferase|tara:strand:+ start:251 stop:601 length:351 start_codon:yes stop_codon:yes gene_type:complete